MTGRYDGYLVLNAGPAEMHFSSDGDVGAPGQAFVHVADARRLWKQLKDAGVAGIGPVEDQPHGLREFVATDPDGNRIRVGSPIHGPLTRRRWRHPISGQPGRAPGRVKQHAPPLLDAAGP